MLAEAKPLSRVEQHLLDLSRQYSELQPEWLHGYLNCLELGECSLYWSASRAKPYRVMWQSSGDRKVKGEWKAVDYIRTRAFTKVESAIKFMKEMQ